jgi:hypothetical protein
MVDTDSLREPRCGAGLELSDVCDRIRVPWSPRRRVDLDRVAARGLGGFDCVPRRKAMLPGGGACVPIGLTRWDCRAGSASGICRPRKAVGDNTRGFKAPAPAGSNGRGKRRIAR